MEIGSVVKVVGLDCVSVWKKREVILLTGL